ncbi:MAG TPA: ABC transporter permease [Patescibacteria group bacterium]
MLIWRPSMIREINAIFTLAYRDIIKFLRDRSRIIATFIFPLVFVGVLGSSLQSNLGQQAGYNLLLFSFTGVIGQTLFQSTAAGIISLIEDKENDFAQEIFVAPISRPTIIVGKIIGESFVALIQTVGIIIFGFIVGLPLHLINFFYFIPFAVLICLLGGAFGVLVMSNLSSQRSANQIFPFIIFPQFFLGGVFSPIKNLPPVLFILSRLSPMTYAVDLTRNFLYLNNPSASKVILHSLSLNLIITVLMFVVFIAAGTFLFVKREHER